MDPKTKYIFGEQMWCLQFGILSKLFYIAHVLTKNKAKRTGIKASTILLYIWKSAAVFSTCFSVESINTMLYL